MFISDHTDQRPFNIQWLNWMKLYVQKHSDGPGGRHICFCYFLCFTPLPSHRVASSGNWNPLSKTICFPICTCFCCFAHHFMDEIECYLQPNQTHFACPHWKRFGIDLFAKNRAQRWLNKWMGLTAIAEFACWFSLTFILNNFFFELTSIEGMYLT